MVTDILLLAIMIVLVLQMVHREVIARKQAASLTASADAMENLRLTLSMCIDEVRSVQTYGLRLQK
jgi:hypothetical protein